MAAHPAQSGPAERTFGIDGPEGLQALWSSVLEAMRRAGLPQVGPEYLKLSRLVAESRRAQLLAGRQVGGAGWDRLRVTAQATADLLRPLVEAARLISELPISIVLDDPPTKPAPAAECILAAPPAADAAAPTPEVRPKARRRSSQPSSKANLVTKVPRRRHRGSPPPETP